MPPGTLGGVAHEICTQLGFRYIAEVGAGAFKETFRVRTSHGIDQALKVFKPGFSPERIRREVQAIIRCRHKFICRLDHIDQLDYQGQVHVFCLEEYIAGGTLASLLARTGTLSVDRVRLLGASLIDAVAHIASLELVHRDLKPENIMLRATGPEEPVIIDFGIVRDLARTSVTQSWLQQGPDTPLFSSPEQLNNDKLLIDWRSDQFSLGIVLSYCAFGIHPFASPGDAAQQIVDRMVGRGHPTSDFRTLADTAGMNTLQMMLAPWPAQRYRTPEMLGKAWNSEGKR